MLASRASRVVSLIAVGAIAAAATVWQRSGATPAAAAPTPAAAPGPAPAPAPAPARAPVVRTDIEATEGPGFVADMRNIRVGAGNRVKGMLPDGADRQFDIGAVAAGRKITLYGGKTVKAPAHSFALTVKGRHADAAYSADGRLIGGGWHVRHMNVISPRGVPQEVTVFVQTSIAKGLAVRDDGKASVVGGAMISVKTQRRLGLFDATQDIPDCAFGGTPSGRYVSFSPPPPEGYVPPPKPRYTGPARPRHQYQIIPTNICPPTSATCPGPVRRHKASLMNGVSHLAIT